MENMNAIVHAAEISPLVTERSLGADLPKWSDVKEVDKNNPKPHHDTRKTPPIKNLIIEKFELSPRSITTMDLDAIQSRILCQEEKQIFKAELREQFRQIADSRPMSQQQLTTCTAYKAWLSSRKILEQNILQQAKEITEREMYEMNLELFAVQSHTDNIIQQLRQKASELKKAHEEEQKRLQKEKDDQQRLQQQQQQELQQQQLQQQQQQVQLQQQREEQEHQKQLLQQQQLQQEQMQQQQQQQQQQPAATEHVSQQQPVVEISNIGTPERIEFLAKVNAVYLQKVNASRALQADKNAKAIENVYRMKINALINTISPISENLNENFVKILQFFNGQPTNNNISINSHPMGKDYCILLMAQKFVDQADTTFSSNLRGAFPFASIVVALWQHLPEFGETFLAHLYKESPFLLPHFITPKKGQDTVTYLNLLGYRLIEDGALESHDDFLKRQMGMARLYAAVMATGGRKADASMQHPHGVEQAWRWLANFLRLDPLPDISATILLEMLQIGSSTLLTAYGNQFTKLVFYVQQHYMPKFAESEKGPKTRLQDFLLNFLEKGQITRPVGMLPPNFW